MKYSFLAGMAYSSPAILPYFYDNQFTFWHNNYFEFRLCWGFFTSLLPIFILSVEMIAKSNSFVRRFTTGVLMGIFVSLSMFFVAFYPYMLLLLFILVLIFGKAKFSKRIEVFLPLTLGSLVIQYFPINAAKYLYLLSHRSQMDKVVKNDDSITNFVQLLISPDTFYSILIKPFLGNASGWNFFTWQPFLLQVYFCLFGIVIFFIPNRKKELLSLFIKAFLSFFLIYFCIDSFHVLFNLLTKAPYSPSIFRRLDSNYLWFGQKFGVAIVWTFTCYLLIEFINETKYFPIFIKKILSLSIFLFCLSAILIPTLKYREESIKHWFINGSSLANYESNRSLKNILDLQKSGSVFRIATLDNGLLPSYLNVRKFETFGGFSNIYSLRFSKFFIEATRPQLRNYFETQVKDHISKNYEDWEPSMSNNVFLKRTTDDIENNYNLNLLALANVRFLISKKS